MTLTGVSGPPPPLTRICRPWIRHRRGLRLCTLQLRRRRISRQVTRLPLDPPPTTRTTTTIQPRTTPNPSRTPLAPPFRVIKLEPRLRTRCSARSGSGWTCAVTPCTCARPGGQGKTRRSIPQAHAVECLAAEFPPELVELESAVGAGGAGAGARAASTKVKRRGSSGLLLRAVAVANNAGQTRSAGALPSPESDGEIAQGQRQAPSPTTALYTSTTVGGVCFPLSESGVGARPSLASVRKASEEARTALLRP
ncbi:hypothetical protein CVT25_013661 [Psilocybe cyanescens]|uniref:Uncharacterized protein n=1 Tax=Psilocybe cyanescens TaxID=93625 RepID=A0A409WTE0_PSICY|nr:hypothetical protein CVT25_013661 [Psilocybe cyanescens]